MLDGSVLSQIGVCYIEQEEMLSWTVLCQDGQKCANLDRSVLNCTGECYVGRERVKLDWSVLN